MSNETVKREELYHAMCHSGNGHATVSLHRVHSSLEGARPHLKLTTGVDHFGVSQTSTLTLTPDLIKVLKCAIQVAESEPNAAYDYLGDKVISQRGVLGVTGYFDSEFRGGESGSAGIVGTEEEIETSRRAMGASLLPEAPDGQRACTHPPGMTVCNWCGAGPKVSSERDVDAM